MIYFDNEYLMQYLNSGLELQVLVNNKLLSIPDVSDIEDSSTGIGYDKNGAPSEFNYVDITQIYAGEHIFTRDQLNAKYGQETEPEADKGAEEEKPKGEKLPLDAPAKEDEKKPKESYVNKYIQNKDPKSPYYGTKGVVISEANSVVMYKTYVDGTYQTVSCLVKHIQDG